ncbi:MAG TPA: MBL fold metallo-hydrolase [Planctomycetaceae bacterium]|nr:MBL fold metallo-hydrolase [Planctomycetaceae bacterium]
MTDMTVRFWGTRGSIPTPGREMEKYGGNTTCLEVRCGETIIVFDAGSGIRVMGQQWNKEFAERPAEAALLFTHLHWDHIQGFPFFAPAYDPRSRLTVYGEDRPGGDIREQLSGQMQGAYFPIPLSFMQGDLRFEPIRREFEIGQVKVRTFPLPHPGGCVGYRLEANGAVFVLATDCELDQVIENREEILADPQAPRRFPAELLEAMRGATLVVIDAQYTDEQYQRCAGWGHNSLSSVVSFCAEIRPHILALTHHDPQSTDGHVTAMLLDAIERLEVRGVHDTLVFAAREGLTMKVAVPQRPLQPM